MIRLLATRWTVSGAALLLLAFCLIPAIALADPALPLTSEQVQATARDQTNRVHLVWIEQGQDESSRLLYQVQERSGIPLGPAVILHESASRIRRPHIVIDPNQTVHLLWQERFAKGAGARNPQGTWVHYAQLAQGRQGPVMVRAEILNQRPVAMHPDLAVDAQGVAYSVWEEGEDSVILARIGSPNAPIERHRIAANFGKERHGYPAVAVDRSGNVHLAWTNFVDATSKQIVYATLRAGLSGQSSRVVSQQPVYTSAPVFGQPKTIAVDQTTGRITIAWRNQRGRGPIGLETTANTLTLSPINGNRRAGQWKGIRVLSVIDASLTSLPSPVRLAVPVAALGKPLTLTIIQDTATRVTPPADFSRSTLRRFDDAVEKLRLTQLLQFSSWSGPPPTGGGVSHALQLVPPAVSLLPDRSRQLNQPSLLPETTPWPLTFSSQREVTIQTSYFNSFL